MGDNSNADHEVGRWLSDRRFAPYLAATADVAADARDLYEWNIRLAGALFEVVAHVEVLIRNAIHDQMKAATPANALHSWLTDSDVLQDKQIQAVQEAVARLKRSKKAPTEDRVVAGLYFSFWAAMLGRAYEELWRQSLARAFPNADNRNHLAGPLNRLVQLRNKLAHHETLIDEPIADHLERVLFVADSVDHDARAWIAGTSRILTVLSERP
jgi:hypothetical protein